MNFTQKDPHNALMPNCCNRKAIFCERVKGGFRNAAGLQLVVGWQFHLLDERSGE